MLVEASNFHAVKPTRKSLESTPAETKQKMFFCFLATRCILKIGRTEIVKFCVLASGSSGNAALLATDQTRILVDAGLSMRELARRLSLIGEDIEALDAIVVTHEHTDHISGLPVLARSKQIRAVIYATRLCAPQIDWGVTAPALQTFQAGASFQIGDIEVASFSVPHDSVDPVGFCLVAGGLKFGIATDLGYVPESIKYHLRYTDVLVLEANHDLDMLKVGPYPWSVKQRVMSRVGHLSNLGMSEFLMEDLDASTEHLILGHLSEHNNHPEIVRLVANEVLQRRGLATRLAVACQNAPSPVLQF
jgi:phosphoribosyl 1,2-cyclic phosphodiesterase